ncbi:hypothetical protein ABPG72_004441 [Tetrahymena utriculariae]
MNKQPQSATQIISNNLSRRQSDNISKKGSKDKNVQLQKVHKHLNHNSYNAINCQSNLNNLSHQNTINVEQKPEDININNCINDFFVEQSFNQNRKTRSNSCAGAVKTNQRQKQLQNQDQQKCEISTKDKECAAIELYNYVKSNIEKSILNEFDTFQDVFQDTQDCQFSEKDLLLNIKQLIEIHFIQSKASEKELKEKHEQECDSYDKNLQRLEAQIREHIRIQQELKLYLESSQIKCQEQEEQIKNLEKFHAQQTDFLEKVCEQMQQQLEIKDSTIKDLNIQISQLKQEIYVLKENQTQKSAQNIPKSKIQSEYHYYSKQLINNLSNQRSQTESSSQRKIKLTTPTSIQMDSNNLIQIDQSLLEDKENNQTQANQIHVSLYKGIKTQNKEEISPEKKIQTIIQQQKQQDSQHKQQNRYQEQVLLFNEKKSQVKNISEKAQLLKGESANEQKNKKKETINGETSIQYQIKAQKQQQIIYQQPNLEKQNTSNLQTSSSTSNNNNNSNIQIKSNRNIPSNLESKYSTTVGSKYQTELETKLTPNQSDQPKNFQEKMIQASKKIKDYIQLSSARDKNNPNNKQQLLNRLKHFSMKNSRAPSISNQNKLIQYFYEKFEDKLERNPSERSNIKQKMKTLQQISDRRYSTINHKTEESEADKKIAEQKKSQRHNRSNSFNIGSQQHSSSNYTESKQIECKFAKKQKNFIPINSTQSSHNNMSNSGLVTNNYNLNQIGNLNTNSSNISNFIVNNSFCNWNKRRESVFNQSGTNNNISFQLEGAQKIIMNNNYIDESSDSFENFIKDNFILTNNSTENLKTLEL